MMDQRQFGRGWLCPHTSMQDIYINQIERCRHWIEAALEYSGGTHNFDDIVDGIKEGRMQLWPSARGCIVTEIVIYPRKKYLNIFLAGGELDQILDMHDSVRAWMIEQKCDAAMMSGRLGWKKPLEKQGWSFLQAHFVKEV